MNIIILKIPYLEKILKKIGHFFKNNYFFLKVSLVLQKSVAFKSEYYDFKNSIFGEVKIKKIGHFFKILISLKIAKK